jgi:hypothetical protein
MPLSAMAATSLRNEDLKNLLSLWARHGFPVGTIYTGLPINHREARIAPSGTMVAVSSRKGIRSMLARLARLFVIKTRLEAFLIIYALALGAVERGSVYLHQFPGLGGKILFLACTCAVFMAGARILDCLKYERAAEAAKPF